MIFENETLFQFRNKLVFGAGKYWNMSNSPKLAVFAFFEWDLALLIDNVEKRIKIFLNWPFLLYFEWDLAWLIDNDLKI
jgi:hypothetical protein